MNRILFRTRTAIISALLSAAIAASLVSAFLLRFDFAVPAAFRAHILVGVLIAVPTKLAVLFVARLHRGWWSYAGTRELLRILAACTAASAAFCLPATIVFHAHYPRSIYVLDFLLSFLLISGLRLFARFQRELLSGGGPRGKAVLVYGAGWAGTSLVRELHMNRSLGYRVVGLLDDDRRKRDDRVLAVRVLGAGRDAVRIAQHFRRKGDPIQEALVAIPCAPGKQVREALANCRAAGLVCRTLPSLGDLLEGRALRGQVRQISVEDLLGREPVRLDQARIWNHLANRVILVTGAAGSIGSELCRQICAFQPRALVLFDQAESDLVRIDLELRTKFAALDIFAEIGDIRRPQRIERVIASHAVDVLFHAAAYKHVPLMEQHVAAAVENNVLATYRTAMAALNGGVRTFVLISSDKAVNPCNIMGATKRAAELIVSSFPSGERAATRFVAVRFGNVLGSNGSVVPVFQRQIATGGPVTVTHPEVRRYFMTVREAAQLVLQASTMGKGSEIYVLDMGELVRIADLARNMIRLAGFTPDEDIEIRYIGLRPGEKLFEELVTGGENILPTHHEKIKIFRGEPASRDRIEHWLSKVRPAVARQDHAALVRLLAELIPEYDVSEFWTSKLAGAPAPAADPTIHALVGV